MTEHIKASELIDAIDNLSAKIDIGEDGHRYEVVVSGLHKGGIRTEEQAWNWLQGLRAGLQWVADDAVVSQGTEMFSDAAGVPHGGMQGWL